jgi:hypothetical protein
LKKHRISIAGLMAFIVLIAVGFAALKDPTDLWTSLVFTLAIATAAACALGTIASRGSARPLWLGSSLSTGVYLLLAFGPWFSTEAKPHLLTAWGLERAYPRIHTKPMLTVAQRGHSMLHILGGAPHDYAVESADNYLSYRGAAHQMNFERIGHSLAAMACGLMGALVVGVLAPREIDRERQDVPRRITVGRSEV